MLDFMRKNKRSVIVLIPIGIIIVVFIGWGARGGSSGVTSPLIVLAVDERTIPTDYFLFNKGILSEAVQNRVPEGVSPDDLDKWLDLKILIPLLQEALLVRIGEDLGLAVTDEELDARIRKDPRFRDGERYRPDFLDYVLARYQIKYGYFRRNYRAGVLAAKTRRFIQASAVVSEEEAYERFSLVNERVKLEFLRFDPKHYKAKAKPDKKEIDELLESDLPAVESEYERRKAQYVTPKEVKASEILFAVPFDASQEAENAIREKARAVAEQARQGKKPFAQLAKAYSDGPEGPQGGDLGTVRPGSHNPAIEAFLFKAKKGEVSDPILTREGYHVVRINAVKQDKSVSFEEAKRELAAALLKVEIGEKRARARAEETLSALVEGKDIRRILEKDGIAWDSTPPFNYASALGQDMVVSRVGYAPKLKKIAFRLKEEEPLHSELVSVGQQLLIVRLKERTRATREDFEFRKKPFMQSLRTQRERLAVEMALAEQLRTAEISCNEQLLPDTCGIILGKKSSVPQRTLPESIPLQTDVRSLM